LENDNLFERSCYVRAAFAGNLAVMLIRCGRVYYEIESPV